MSILKFWYTLFFKSKSTKINVIGNELGSDANNASLMIFLSSIVVSYVLYDILFSLLSLTALIHEIIVLYIIRKYRLYYSNIQMIERQEVTKEAIKEWAKKIHEERAKLAQEKLSTTQRNNLISKTVEDWLVVLNLEPKVSSLNLKMIKDRYWKLAQRYHPDNKDTGDHDRFAEINQAYHNLNSLLR